MSGNFPLAWKYCKDIMDTMHYGNDLNVPLHVWRRFVPRPDPLQQLMLATSGHRPEVERTPVEWFEFWLNGPTDDDFLKTKKEPFQVEEHPMSGDIIVKLPERLCPRCQGRGSYQTWPQLPSQELHRMGAVPFAKGIKVVSNNCDHKLTARDKV